MDITVVNQAHGDNWAMYHGDCIDVIRGLPTDKLHYQLFSLPFESLYTYSASDRDMGNSKDSEQFWEHYRFLVAEQFRVCMPGRLLSTHCMNLPTSKQNHGFIGLRDFRGEIIRAYVGDEAAEMFQAIGRLKIRASNAEKEGDFSRANRLSDVCRVMEDDLTTHPGERGMIFHSEVVIWKDPVTAMQRTKALGLLHKQIKKDSCMSRQGIPDYVVTMRKPGDNPERVTHTNESFPVQVWQRYASPVWMDINPSNTLQFRSAREHDDERHICPLQLEVIERCLELWTNPGDLVFSPFAGIGSEGYVALKMGRKFLGAELKRSYFETACRNLEMAKQEQGGLFAEIAFGDEETAGDEEAA